MKQDVIEINDVINFIENRKLTNTKLSTQRSYISEDTIKNIDINTLQNLITTYVRDANKEPLAEFFSDLVRGFNNKLLNGCQTYYRSIDGSIKICSHYIGPSPKTHDGRYNVEGEKCIYLIDKPEFLHLELNLLKTSCIRIQKYNLPNTLKIANVSSENEELHNDLKAAFYMTEQGRTESGYSFETLLGPQGKSKYLVSQLLAATFKQAGWDGLFIPGVHGEENRHYHNIVIFEPAVHDWEKWVNGHCYLY